LIHHERVSGPAAERTAFVLHGIFGAGKNWLFFMRRLAAARADWGFVLPDLRGHGQSQGAPAPHDLRAAAGDLVALEAQLAGPPMAAVIGHSFGGKVALAYAAERPVGQVWLLDSNPGTRADAEASPTSNVLRTLEALPARFAARGDFIRALEQRSIDSATAAWLAMSLVRTDDGFTLGLDLAAIRSMLADYFARDFWPELERTDRETHLVAAERSFVWEPADWKRLADLAAHNPHFHLHRIPEAGHWVHVDAPDALAALFATAL
jgi:esterase